MLLIDLYLLRPSPYRHACEHPLSYLWASGCLLATGSLYGFLVALFQRRIGGDIQGFSLDQFSNTILLAGNLLSGLLVVLVFHGGVTLIVWLMARAVGGSGRLGDLYRATAYLLSLSAPALPQLALGSATQGRDVSLLPWVELYPILAWIGLLLMLLGLYQLLRVTQGLVPTRAGAAVVITTLFCYAVLLVAM